MSGFLSAAGRTVFQLAFQASPIILVDGIASFVPGGMLPIIGITEPLSIVNGVFSGTFPTSLDELFAQFVPLPGASLINNQIGMYPFANQQIAANAIIEQPLNISMMMIAPVRDPGGYVAKIATFTALQAALKLHNSSGGTYTIVTPSFVFTNCVMTMMQDVTGGDTKQAQVQWQLDFIRPLITLQQATQAYNGLMGQMSQFLPIVGNPSYSGASVAGTSGTSILGSNVSSYLSAPTIPVTAEPL